MKRSRCLEPFSRDHGVNLVCAQRVCKALSEPSADLLGVVKQIRATYCGTIVNYLEDEQWVLSPLILDDEMRSAFHERHRHIRGLITELDGSGLADQGEISILSIFADALEQNVRWEEQTLFPRIEVGIEDNQLRHLCKLTSRIELSRIRPTQYQLGCGETVSSAQGSLMSR